MPALSPTMETGNLAKWLVREGDAIEPGDVIAEIETDKATMEVESADEGTVGKIVVPEGAEDVAVGALIAVLLEEGEDKSALESVKEEAPKPKAEAPKEAPPKEEPAPPPEQPATPAPIPQSSSGRVKASPLAKRIAGEKGVNLSAIQGSGPAGRIIKRDVEGAQA